MDAFFNTQDQSPEYQFLSKIIQLVKNDEPLVYTVKQAADKLQMSKSKVYELARQKDFPSVKIGGRVMIPRQKLEEWINQQAE
ncbi:hypothetical protein GCM10007416_32470 [Kroppenstedtia guangzhouensis]|uniref:Helix-turn-helix domain-containing protein n=1 Tax=Kroppenstedtia guangzhouensis TaxID=1274356 RepID=A0ABQ1H2R6_9BACL|nr:helix-turn-helix domain-containing protein [Kroppenstedtia guangzhouensis]GGA56763.1 hypothetical protein GCM10007416_32470 [Kroppenstedtia guangzhouensis]